MQLGNTKRKDYIQTRADALEKSIEFHKQFHQDGSSCKWIAKKEKELEELISHS